MTQLKMYLLPIFLKGVKIDCQHWSTDGMNETIYATKSY